MMKKISEETDYVCTCMCHHEGVKLLHCMLCCDLTYETYIVDGTVHTEKLETLRQKNDK